MKVGLVLVTALAFVAMAFPPGTMTVVDPAGNPIAQLELKTPVQGSGYWNSTDSAGNPIGGLYTDMGGGWIIMTTVTQDPYTTTDWSLWQSTPWWRWGIMGSHPWNSPATGGWTAELPHSP